jgi:hypothetical protein
MAHKLFLFVQFIPLSVFLAIIRWSDGTGPNWKLAFIIGGCIAVIESILLFIRKIAFDRFIMAVNLFLFVGGMGFLFRIYPILNLYRHLMQSALFAALLLVGFVTTFFSVYGFIGVKHPNKQIVRSRSIYLLIASLFAFVISILFRGNMLLAGILPFIGLLIVGKVLCKKLNSLEGDVKII